MKEVRIPKLKDQSAAYKLFHYPYMWMFSSNEKYDENDTEFFGRATSGNAQLDYNIATAKTAQYITTAEAAEMSARGVSVTLVDPEDSITIYLTICQHLADWHNQVQRAGVISKLRHVPVEGLKEFNQLARNLALVGRRHGLVDKFDPYKAARSRRTFKMGYTPEVNLATATHSDDILMSIVSFDKERRKR